MMFYSIKNRLVCKRDFSGCKVDERRFKGELLNQVYLYISNGRLGYVFKSGKVKATIDLFDYLDELRGRIVNSLESGDFWELDDIELYLLKEIKKK